MIGKQSNRIYFAYLIVKIFFPIFVLTLIFPAKAQDAEDIVNKLIEMGFENVSWVEDQEERIYMIENNVYRLTGVGIGKAVDLIQQTGIYPGKICRVIVTDNNVPQLSLVYHPYQTDSTYFASLLDWEVSYDLGDGWEKIKKQPKKNRSLYKVDFVVYPELSFKNLIVIQIYQVLFNLSPAVEVSLWEGMKFSGQLVFPVYNDGYGNLAGKVHPGFISLSQSIRFPKNIFATASVGLFNADRYGIDLKLFYPLQWMNERISFNGRISSTGTGYWDGFKYYYGTKQRVTWSLGASYYWDRYNTIFNLNVEQYLLQEKGVYFEFIRNFRYTSIGFYAAKAQYAEMYYGFRFQVALPPYKYKRKGYYPRVLPSNQMGLNYNGSNEQYYYRTFRTQPGDNIMQKNSFNPYFIKSELLNF